MKKRKIDIEDLEDARYLAGFSISRACEYLEISERTYFRWKQRGRAPRWALVALKVQAGYLDDLGWKGWYIFQGVLYSDGLDPKRYSWHSGNLMAEAFWRCNGKHADGKTSIHDTDNIRILDIHRAKKVPLDGKSA